MNRHLAHRESLLLPAFVLLTAAACTSTTGFEVEWKTTSGRGIDAQSYVEAYESGALQGLPSGTVADLPASGGAQARGRVVQQGLLDDNTFIDAGTSGFVDTAGDPLSTFGLDVDTSSYSVARTLLQQDVLPPRASIRVEEWVNSFDYGDEAPTEQDLGMTIEQGQALGAGDSTSLVRVGSAPVRSPNRTARRLT